ncbi:MAG: lamin tail domain-containing protein [Methanoregula sp.]|jgi:competence protein ComEC|nr:lamin tail domain-containing protein [Methanoregula sp.]
MNPPASFSPTARICISLLLLACIFSAGCTDLLNEGSRSSLDPDTTGDLQAYFLDVGQGDSSVILFRDKVILIDAGEVNRGDQVVSNLQKLGVNRIDLLVATHPHSDHIGGMAKILAAFPVEKVLDSGTPSTSQIYETFLDTIDKKNIPYIAAEPGQTIDLDPSLRILVISPPKEQIGDDINTNSIVLRISYGTVNLLYTGDATSATEDEMLKNGYPLDAQVIKVGHHGSSGSSSTVFLSRVRPELAVISLAADNPYGHPHDEALERLLAAGPTIYRTDRDGTILIRSDGAAYSVTAENGGEDIWVPKTTVTVTTAPVASPTSPATTAPVTPSPVVTIPTIPSNISVPVPSFTMPAIQVGNASSIRISATQFDAPGDDRENLNGEWVRLTNNGDGPVLIAGWTLTDTSGTNPYTFPAIVLLPAESVTVHVGSGTMNGTTLFMGRTAPLFGNTGDTAFLKDGSGNVVDQRSEG